MNASPERSYLLVRCRSWLCAIPLAGVIETMRVLPLQPVAGVPAFVRGLALVRGELVPVIELAVLLGTQEPGTTHRLVLVRTQTHWLALAVDEVLRVVSGELPRGAEVAPLLSQALPEQVAALATLDGAALAILQSTNLLSADLFAAVLQQTAPVGR